MNGWENQQNDIDDSSQQKESHESKEDRLLESTRYIECVLADEQEDYKPADAKSVEAVEFESFSAVWHLLQVTERKVWVFFASNELSTHIMARHKSKLKTLIQRKVKTNPMQMPVAPRTCVNFHP